jgi:hypothetical protein
VLTALQSLTTSLEDRCAAIEAMVAGSSQREIEHQRAQSLRAVETVRPRLDALQRALRTADTASAAPALRTYRVLSDVLRGAESIAMPTMERFGPQDQRVTGLLRGLLADAGWTEWVPAVLTWSTSYFYTFDGWRVVGVRADEQRRLLRIPDLCHEFGHCLIAARDAELTAILDLDMAHWSSHAAQAAQAGKSVPDAVYALWSSHWRVEFTCDAIGTYLTGPSYAHQHLALSASMPFDPYGHAPSHPADEARSRVIAETLRRIGLQRDAADFERRWSELRRALEQPVFMGGAMHQAHKPDDFEDHYPTDPTTGRPFVARVAELSVAGLGKLGLEPFDAGGGPSSSVAALVAEAWSVFLRDPGSYSAWESDQIGQLYARLGI